MAFNGSGTFNLPTGNPVVVNTTIDAAVHNNTKRSLLRSLTVLPVMVNLHQLAVCQWQALS